MELHFDITCHIWYALIVIYAGASAKVSQMQSHEGLDVGTISACIASVRLSSLIILHSAYVHVRSSFLGSTSYVYCAPGPHCRFWIQDPTTRNPFARLPQLQFV